MGVKLVKKKDLYSKFEKEIKRYGKLRDVLASDFERLLKDNGIKFQKFESRIKEYPKFLEKVFRKNYTDPFRENEDFCGFRIVCYYLSDLDKIDGLLCDKFNILRKEDASDKLEVMHFAYRSNHYVAKLKPYWLKLPKFTGLENTIFEIQVRTINMHSWSEASHNLDYKYETLVPKILRRKLFRASAFLEQADSIFEEVRIAKLELSKNEDKLSIDSLKGYLERKFKKEPL